MNLSKIYVINFKHILYRVKLNSLSIEIPFVLKHKHLLCFTIKKFKKN